MAKLERLTQNNEGKLYRSNGTMLRPKNAVTKGMLTTIVVENPSGDIIKTIEEMARINSNFIPENSNAYLISRFNEDTRHLRKISSNGDKKSYCVYALQFYQAYPKIES